MFEKVGKSGAPLRLRPEPDVVVHGNPDDPGAAVRRQQHPKTIGQPQALDW